MTPPTGRDARRERQVALAVLAVAVVLLVSSVTWFGSGRTTVGVAQLVVAVLVAGIGVFLLRRSRSV